MTGATNELSLIAEPSRACAGATLILSPKGPGADDLTGGVVSYFQAPDDDGWSDLYLLFSPVGSVAGPDFKRSDDDAGMIVVPAVGIRGPVRVVVPPVPAGTYRIRRGFFGSRSSPPRTEVMLHAPIEVIP